MPQFEQGGILMSSSISPVMSGSYYGVTSDFFNTTSLSEPSTSYLSDYSGIRNGSYYKLMRAYYGGSSNAEALVDSSKTSTTTSADKINATLVKDEADALRDSTSKLLENGSKSLFNKTLVKDADGKETQGYDMDSIYKSVSSFVKDYNSLIGSVVDSSNTSVLSSTASIVGNTKANEKLLSSVGIALNADNTLSIDEDAFKSAEGSTVKSLFNGTGSYGYGVASNTSQIYNQSVSQLAQLAGTSYSSTGNYDYNSTGSLFSSFL